MRRLSILRICNLLFLLFSISNSQIIILNSSGIIHADAHFIGSANLDTDTQEEMVYSYSDGFLAVIDGLTGVIEWEDSNSNLSSIRVRENPFVNLGNDNIGLTFKASDGLPRAFIYHNGLLTSSDGIHADAHFIGSVNLDTDIQEEMVYNSGDGFLAVIDGLTGIIEWEDSNSNLSSIRVRENPFVNLGNDNIGLTFKASDGLPRAFIYHNGLLTSSDEIHADAHFIGSANLDTDIQEEMVYNSGDGFLAIIDGSTGVIEWNNLNNNISSLRVSEYPFVLLNNDKYALTFKGRDNSTGDSKCYIIGCQTSTSLIDQDIMNTLEYRLDQNYPNPFNPTTTISYEIKSKDNVKIEIYNIKGQLVRTLLNEEKNPGEYQIIWEGKDHNNILLSTGFYFYQLKIGDYTSTKKAIIIK